MDKARINTPQRFSVSAFQMVVAATNHVQRPYHADPAKLPGPRESGCRHRLQLSWEAFTSKTLNDLIEIELSFSSLPPKRNERGHAFLRIARAA